MNEKRFMVTAERVDKKGLITGNFIKYCGKPCIYVERMDEDNFIREAYGFNEIDPATVEPVAMPVICKITSNGEDVGYEFAHYYCPNCLNAVIVEYRKEKESVRYEPNYCIYCGQHLDWQIDTPELLTEG